MAPDQPGPLALVGSGEYLPHMAAIEGDLLAGRPGRYVQLATAAVPDGPAVLAKWHDLGRQQAARLGVEAVIVDVRDRESADDPSLAALIPGAGLIYLSGGQPAYLADSLRGSAVWAAIVAAWKGGAALAGCSAGAMALTSWVPSIRDPDRPATEGLGVVPHLRVIPHFDMLSERLPELASRLAGAGGPPLVGIDEDTAMVGGPETWTVRGRQSVWALEPGGRTEHPPGSTVVTPAAY